ncbi:MAG: DUF5706 domain-containing protein [Bacteroidia bacterium]|jgi:hypothetical protein|nr:DUF5706 domain-containing protein [Bacteroidia bacterium]
MNEDYIIQFYQLTFNSIDNLTRFAEAKNAGLIVFNSTLIFAVLSSIKDLGTLKFKKWTFTLLSIMIITQLISLSIAFNSLIARTQVPTQTQIDINKTNLTFFGHISRLTPDDYYNLTISKYNLKSSNLTLEKDYAFDIVQISVITAKKFTLFNIAIKFNIITLIVFIIWFIGFLFLTKKSCFISVGK